MFFGSGSGLLLSTMTLAAVLAVGGVPKSRSPHGAAPKVTQAERWARAIERSTDWGELELCLPQLRRAGDGDLRSLAIAIVATESYLRPGWVRQAKFAVAWVYWPVFGALPDISLGVAQMKPSTAARLLASDDMDKIWASLRDTCASVALVAAYLQASLSAEQSLRDRLARYNGQRASSDGRSRASIYSEVALAVAHMRFGVNLDCEGPRSHRDGEASRPITACKPCSVT